ncbi:hypothetical protein K469DRAFT_566291, partial [Zopfia rhizophila CBS 207.26]
KSQLAIEHCYQTTDRSPETWVFGVYASNMERIEQGYRDIADRVKLPGRNDPQVDVFELVYSWLRNEKNRKWLLVLDNANDIAALFRPPGNSEQSRVSGGDGASSRYFSMYLPQSKIGSVLVTSRTRTALPTSSGAGIDSTCSCAGGGVHPTTSTEIFSAAVLGGVPRATREGQVY